MKLVIGSLIVSMSAVFVAAQDTPTPAATAQSAKVIAELSAAKPSSSMKNVPFSAEEVNESVQTLADGNRISRSSTGKIYRNSEGRVRREINSGLGGVMGSTFTISGGGVSVIDPVMGQKFQLDTELKMARVAELKAGQEIAIASGVRAIADEDKAKLLTKLQTEYQLKGELKALEPIAPVPSVMAVPSMSTTIAPMAVQGGGFAYSMGPTSKYETHSEDLGTRDFEGVSAEGSRKITTIPAGAIGNERPIEISYERWFSKDLGMVVYSKNTDPRFGEQIYRMTNIVRAEPDPSLFAVPSGYRKVNGGTAYRVTPSRTTEAERTSAAAKAQTTFVRNKP